MANVVTLESLRAKRGSAIGNGFIDVRACPQKAVDTPEPFQDEAAEFVENSAVVF